MSLLQINPLEALVSDPRQKVPSLFTAPDVIPGKFIQCGGCERFVEPTESWQCPHCKISAYFGAVLVTCGVCGDANVLANRTGYAIKQLCRCNLTPEQLEARRLHAISRAEDEAKEANRLAMAELVRQNAAAEQLAAEERLAELKHLRVLAQECWDRKGRICDVTMAALEHRACPKCPKFRATRPVSARRKRNPRAER